MAGSTVRDLMDTTFVKLRADMPVTEAIGILMEERITGAAVVDENDHVLGLLSERDCLRPLLAGAYARMPQGLVSDSMMSDVFSVHPDTDIYKLAELFVQQVNRRFLVVEDSKLIGQITRRDLLRSIQKQWT